MKKTILIMTGFIMLLVLGACSNQFGMMNSSQKEEKQMPSNHMNQSEEQPHSTDNRMGMMHHDHDMPLQSSQGKNELKIPPMLESDKETEHDVYYTIDAQQGQTEIFDGVQTKTLGYNASFLGPVVKLKKGQTAHITLKNNLDEETTFHWHGLIIDGEADGGPHTVIQPGEEKEITFDVQQDQATLWFHPHPEGKTAKQVFDGLAGLLYIENEEVEDTYEYGENDFPLILQDRTFDDEKQLDYEAVKDSDGTMGETLLINGTVNPRLTVQKEKVRLRLLNGSNMRNYTIKLNNDQSFEQIASDGGLLNEPVELNEITLTPSERAEIVVDFSQFKTEEVELMMDDGTTLLPFKLKEKDEEENSAIGQPEKQVTISDEEMQKPVSKEVNLSGMGRHVLINGKKFDKNRIDFTQKQGETEVWEVYNEPDMMGGMIHPFHIHGTQFKVISINGETPPKNLQGYKDTISLEAGDRAKIAVKFEEKGIYMYHCHILEHEDNGMMGQIKVE